MNPNDDEVADVEWMRKEISLQKCIEMRRFESRVSYENEEHIFHGDSKDEWVNWDDGDIVSFRFIYWSESKRKKKSENRKRER